jgi:ABC-type dipeptide/oligopeptide/nickel transport system permease subunit
MNYVRSEAREAFSTKENGMDIKKIVLYALPVVLIIGFVFMLLLSKS